MPGDRCFLDTNVVVYAYDATAGKKRDSARALIRDLWDSRRGCLSVQVLQEFFVTVTRKVPRPLDASAAARIVEDLSRWRVHAPTSRDVVEAIEIHRHEQVSFWDAMILCSADQEGCGTVYSEDLGDGRRYGDLHVHNPFAEPV